MSHPSGNQTVNNLYSRREQGKRGSQYQGSFSIYGTKMTSLRGHSQRRSSLPGGGGGSRKTGKSVVISLGILLFNPDRWGRGSENPDFPWMSLMDGPLGVPRDHVSVFWRC